VLWQHGWLPEGALHFDKDDGYGLLYRVRSLSEWKVGFKLVSWSEFMGGFDRWKEK